MDKVHAYICLHSASIKSTAGNKTMIFRRPFLLSNSSFLILDKAFWDHYVAACSSTLRSANGKNESGGYVTVLKKCTICK